MFHVVRPSLIGRRTASHAKLLDMKNQISLVFALVALLTAASAFALMPPHVTKITPKDGGVVKNGKIVVVGYSLRYAKPERSMTITEVATKNDVAYSHKMTCKSIGKCKNDTPGSCQQLCTVEILVEGVKSGDKIQVKYLKTTATLTIGKDKRKKPAAK